MKRALPLVVVLVVVAAVFAYILLRGRGSGGLEVSGAWVRAVQVVEAAPVVPAGTDAPGMGGTNTAAYLTIDNATGGGDRLLAAFTPAAAAVEMHESAMEGGVMKMRPVAGIEVPAGETVAFQPGGLHLMLINVYTDLAAGSQVPLTLVFERAGSLTVQAEVRAQ